MMPIPDKGGSKGAKMQIFVTGATGYIGCVVTELALAEGHDVHGLSRNEEGDAKLRALGATPVRGELTSLDVLRHESAQTDAVLHLAYIHDRGMSLTQIVGIDKAAVEAMCEPLRGTEKALVINSGTAAVEADWADDTINRDGTSGFLHHFQAKSYTRAQLHALRHCIEGVRVSVIRLPPYVYGRGGSAFVPMLLQMAAKAGESIYVDDGSRQSSYVHVDDAAALYLLVARNAKAGDVFTGTGSTTVTLRELAEAIGAALEVPVRSVSGYKAWEVWGDDFLEAFFRFKNKRYNHKAKQQLGWAPKGVDMSTDIRSGSYRELAEQLRQEATKTTDVVGN